MPDLDVSINRDSKASFTAIMVLAMTLSLTSCVGVPVYISFFAPKDKTCDVTVSGKVVSKNVPCTGMEPARKWFLIAGILIPIFALRIADDFSTGSKTKRRPDTARGENLVNPHGPRGECPNCKSVVALHAEECRRCGALFGTGSSWKVKPLP